MIQIKDKEFVPYINQEALQQRITELGNAISEDCRTQCPILIGVLNGSYMFLGDLSKSISIPIEICFLKIASYTGTSSTGTVNQLMGLDADIADRHVIIVEDIVDTGLSMSFLLEKIKSLGPKSVRIATLLTKPEALKHPINLDYVGFEIPNKFVVGYGLDYDGLGRNLPAIFQLK